MDGQSDRRGAVDKAVQNPIIVNGVNEEDDDVQCIGYEAPLIMGGGSQIAPQQPTPFMPSVSGHFGHSQAMDQYVSARCFFNLFSVCLLMGILCDF